MRTPVSAETMPTRTPTGGHLTVRGRRRRVRALALGTLLAALLAFSTAIEYGLAVGHDGAVAASEAPATGHGSAVANGDGTALGLGR
ncbi:hypothetical protein [Actinomadura chibensis]|uniref:Uncharacterized protein n=1 Tax=Actinomadura chibensis TaxID=392828 RepID=A0A5D0NKG1_9ACTN|nr:hypothetical protein [Actinomadura chibensis]TYB44937.1 hypothetical protein FXF69_22695 [Actinomadura chibensis]